MITLSTAVGAWTERRRGRGAHRELDGHPALTGEIPYERLSPLNLFYLYALDFSQPAARVPRHHDTATQSNRRDAGLAGA
jgi:hypothetical protein